MRNTIMNLNTAPSDIAQAKTWCSTAYSRITASALVIKNIFSLDEPLSAGTEGAFRSACAEINAWRLEIIKAEGWHDRNPEIGKLISELKKDVASCIENATTESKVIKSWFDTPMHQIISL